MRHGSVLSLPRQAARGRVVLAVKLLAERKNGGPTNLHHGDNNKKSGTAAVVVRFMILARQLTRRALLICRVRVWERCSTEPSWVFLCMLILLHRHSARTRSAYALPSASR